MIFLPVETVCSVRLLLSADHWYGSRAFYLLLPHLENEANWEKTGTSGQNGGTLKPETDILIVTFAFAQQNMSILISL